MRRIVMLAVGCVWLAISGTGWADIWSGGHGDIGALLDGNNQLELHFHLENQGEALGGGTIPAGEYAPSALQVFVSGPSISRPAGSQYDFLGVAAGAPVWFLPQENDPSKPFLGLGLEDLDPADWIGALTWTLKGMNGPAGGNFSLWQESFGTGPKPFLTTSDGITNGDKFEQVAGSHEHFNWGFTGEGFFELEFEISGIHNTFGALSDTASFSFISSVPEPSSMALLGCVGLLYAARRIRSRRPSTPA